MPEVTLGEIAKERREVYQGDKSSYPVVGLEHLEPGEIRLSTWSVGGDNTFSKRFCAGDVLFGRRRAYLKKAAQASVDGICSGDITVIQPIPDKVLPGLLPFIIQNDTFFSFAVENSAGSLSPRVKWEHLKHYKINLPPIEEQRKLADSLWAAYDLKESYKRLLAASDELAKSRFIEMFEEKKYPLTTIKEICHIVTDGTHQPPHFVNEGIPFLLVSNIVDYKLTYETTKFISESEYRELIKRTPVEVGDLLLSIVGSYGNPAIVRSERPFCFQRHLAYLKPNRNLISPEFFHAALLTPHVKIQIERKVKGIAQKTLNLSELKSLVLPLPPLALQNGFASFIEQLDKSKVLLQECIANTDSIIKNLLNQNG